MTAASIEFDRVTKRYGDVVAVRDLTIKLAAGTLTVTVEDKEGNTSRIVRRFRVGAD